jgi:broad specificity phosphatase PhoE
VLAGWNDVPLTAEGVVQARAAGRLLVGRQISRVLVSDLQRAMDTARLAVDAWMEATGAAEPDWQIEPGLRERNLGAWQGLRVADLRDDGRIDHILQWHNRPPDGESLAELMGRVLPALQAGADGQATLVVAHGGVLRGVVGLLDGLTQHEAARLRIENAIPMNRMVRTAVWTQLREAAR